MKSKNNGDPLQCAQNLVSIVRGENPMERLKGIDGRYIDMPSMHAETLLQEDIKWVLTTYEPRINTENIDIVINDTEGNHTITITAREV